MLIFLNIQQQHFLYLLLDIHNVQIMYAKLNQYVHQVVVNFHDFDMILFHVMNVIKDIDVLFDYVQFHLIKMVYVNLNFEYQYNQVYKMQLYVNHQMVKKIYQVKFVEDLMMIELNLYIYLNILIMIFKGKFC
jgi:hypothetical protein